MSLRIGDEFVVNNTGEIIEIRGTWELPHSEIKLLKITSFGNYNESSLIELGLFEKMIDYGMLLPTGVNVVDSPSRPIVEKPEESKCFHPKAHKVAYGPEKFFNYCPDCKQEL